MRWIPPARRGEAITGLKKLSNQRGYGMVRSDRESRGGESSTLAEQMGNLVESSSRAEQAGLTLTFFGHGRARVKVRR